MSRAGDRYGSYLVALMDYYGVVSLSDLSEDQVRSYFNAWNEEHKKLS